MATICASGSVWSAVYLDQASSKGDQEGFLIGEVISEVTTNISDSQISGKTEHISMNVYSHHACVEPFSFYDRKGHVDQVRLLAMLKENYKNVVGWYQMRRNVPLEPTLRDITLHQQLLKMLRHTSANTFFMGLFSCNMTWNGSIHSMLHQFYTVTSNGYTAIPMSVSNLGETAQTEYRLSASAAKSTTNSTYSQILNSFKNKLVHPGGTVEGAQKVHLLNDAIQERLKNLTGSVGESEEQVQRLTDEVNDLERRAQRQRRNNMQQQQRQQQVQILMGSSVI
ncbi:BRISC complex subunit abraxas 2-like isoform X2 [Amphiura filiformis]|uniref:BRISC complex subunit abraxas 2-like isoform X2 n=1 Tax=Amphiura filiformis TaxID=82378 RepID=UPI003B22583B